MSAGSPGVNWVFTFNTKGLGVQLEFASADADLNSARFRALEEHHTALEEAFGEPLSWEPRENLMSAGVATYGVPAEVTETERWDEWIDWLIDSGQRFRAALQKVGGVPSV